MAGLFAGEANYLAEAEVRDEGRTPWHIRKAWEGFDKIFSSADLAQAKAEIARYKRFLSHYARGVELEDDER